MLPATIVAQIPLLFVLHDGLSLEIDLGNADELVLVVDVNVETRLHWKYKGICRNY